jgi:hypothetical protein
MVGHKNVRNSLWWVAMLPTLRTTAVEDSLNQKERREIEQKNDVIENISRDKLNVDILIINFLVRGHSNITLHY